MGSSELDSAIPVLPVRDLKQSLAFYRERLGFEAAFEFGPYAGVTREGTELHLSEEEAGPVSCRISVRGVDALYTEMEAQGVVHPEEPLATMPFGMRQFSVLDPSGNRITFAEPADAAEGQSKTRRYAITFTHVEGANMQQSESDVPKMIEAHQAWEREVDAQPHSSLVYFGAAGEAKTVVRGSDGELSVIDGPFTQGPEASGGFFIIEAGSLDEAVDVAKRSRWMQGSNEVRELVTPPGMRWWIRS